MNVNYSRNSVDPFFGWEDSHPNITPKRASLARVFCPKGLRDTWRHFKPEEIFGAGLTFKDNAQIFYFKTLAVGEIASRSSVNSRESSVATLSFYFC